MISVTDEQAVIARLETAISASKIVSGVGQISFKESLNLALSRDASLPDNNAGVAHLKKKVAPLPPPRQLEKEVTLTYAPVVDDGLKMLGNREPSLPTRLPPAAHETKAPFIAARELSGPNKAVFSNVLPLVDIQKGASGKPIVPSRAPTSTRTLLPESSVTASKSGTMISEPNVNNPYINHFRPPPNPNDPPPPVFFAPPGFTPKPVIRQKQVEESNRARALQDFIAQENTDLPFRKGDILEIQSAIDENWYQGSMNGRSGIFPISYVEKMA